MVCVKSCLRTCRKLKQTPSSTVTIGIHRSCSSDPPCPRACSSYFGSKPFRAPFHPSQRVKKARADPPCQAKCLHEDIFQRWAQEVHGHDVIFTFGAWRVDSPPKQRHPPGRCRWVFRRKTSVHTLNQTKPFGSLVLTGVTIQFPLEEHKWWIALSMLFRIWCAP